MVTCGALARKICVLRQAKRPPTPIAMTVATACAMADPSFSLSVIEAGDGPLGAAVTATDRIRGPAATPFPAGPARHAAGRDGYQRCHHRAPDHRERLFSAKSVPFVLICAYSIAGAMFEDGTVL